MGETIAQRYELEAEVAQGPLAVVWRATARGAHGFSRAVAVRGLHPPLAKDRRFVGAWAATASELAEAPSPHVEQVLDVVSDGGRVFVVSEWIEGVSLARWIAAHEGAVPWPLAVEVAIEVLRGLADPHARAPALCHDGIGPAAVRIGRDGTVKLTRFGAAGALAATGMGRRRMEELGVRHAAPELVAGDGSGPATDRFGVGALLFEMLAGAPPFGGAPGLERDAQLTGEPPDLASARPDVPPLVVALVERALRRDPGERFGSVAEMARALAQLLRSQPEPAGPEGLAASLRALGDAEEAEPADEEPAAQPGPAALAASVRGMLDAAPSKRPQGLKGTPQHTMMVDPAELEEVLGRVEGASAEVVDSEPPEAEASEEEPADDGSPRRYRFAPKARTASASARALRAARPPAGEKLEPAESEAAPLPLTTSKRPRGLDPARTELLDEDQVDRLTVPERDEKKPAGLSPAKTEFLDEDQVDRLTLDDD